MDALHTKHGLSDPWCSGDHYPGSVSRFSMLLNKLEQVLVSISFKQYGSTLTVTENGFGKLNESPVDTAELMLVQNLILLLAHSSWSNTFRFLLSRLGPYLDSKSQVPLTSLMVKNCVVMVLCSFSLSKTESWCSCAAAVVVPTVRAWAKEQDHINIEHRLLGLRRIRGGHTPWPLQSSWTMW